MFLDILNESLDKYFEDDFEDDLKNESMDVELSPKFDARKSFYGKAKVKVDDDGTKTLYSYGIPVCEIKDGKVSLLTMWDESQTTLRHVREFLKQNGFDAGSSREMRKLYESVGSSDIDYIADFLEEHDNRESYQQNPDVFLGIYNLFFNHGDIDDDIRTLYSRCTDDEKVKIRGLIRQFN